MPESIQIRRFTFDEVIVRAQPGVINSESLAKPLHMLPVGGKGSWSTQFDELPKLIVRMELSNGVIALGEFYRDHNWQTVRDISEGLLGVDLHALSLQELPLPLTREHDGFECAIWDGWAKSHGLPLHKLLGGAVQEKVRVGAWSSHRTLDEVGPWVKQYQDQGYDCIKFKADLDDDAVGWCEEIAKHAPGMQVIFDPNQRWDGRWHFFAAAAEAMRRILIERARSRATLKRGGERPASLLDEPASPDASPEELVALDDSLARLEAIDPRMAQVVKLRCFVGLSIAETAEALENSSERTVSRLWTAARAWLLRDMRQ